MSGSLNLQGMTLRDRIYNKYDGKCAYTGLDLGDDWQIDHVIPKCSMVWDQPTETRQKLGVYIDSPNDIINLQPALTIVNHYKRALNLENFRDYMIMFHVRLAKLPRKTIIPATLRRIQYMQKIASVFNITEIKPFDGVFYFEKPESHCCYLVINEDSKIATCDCCGKSELIS